ncbi:MAG: class I SAM-dependent rRNA methyltransferase [Chromatiales bacterium]|jgi:23S rRNA (cytosine1962-C5)-methyltransferase
MKEGHVAVRLVRNAERRLRAGHSWVYSNEIDNSVTPLKSFAVGQPVDVLNHQGKWLGAGYINPHSLICVRLLSRNADFPVGVSLLVHRLKIALSLRQRFYSLPYYRLVFAESDGLPGLIIDRYGDYYSVVITTAGIEQLRESLIEAMHKVLKPAGILFRNDSPIRKLEELPLYVELAAGEIPELVTVQEGQNHFRVSLHEGQKTGWFFDQAANRERMLRYVPGKTVLDVCSYIGAWSVRAASAGATAVTSVDVSEAALSALQHNAQLNQVEDKIETLQGDAFKTLRQLKAEGRKFDVVILDPPAFIKRRKDLKQGQIAYRRLNEAAIQLLNNDGILISASCSFHLSRNDLLKLVQQSARHSDRMLQLLEEGWQGVDHPIHPAIEETAYLKALYFRVLKNFQ